MIGSTHPPGAGLGDDAGGGEGVRGSHMDLDRNRIRTADGPLAGSRSEPSASVIDEADFKAGC